MDAYVIKRGSVCKVAKMEFCPFRSFFFVCAPWKGSPSAYTIKNGLLMKYLALCWHYWHTMPKLVRVFVYSDLCAYAQSIHRLIHEYIHVHVEDFVQLILELSLKRNRWSLTDRNVQIVIVFSSMLEWRYLDQHSRVKQFAKWTVEFIQNLLITLILTLSCGFISNNAFILVGNCNSAAVLVAALFFLFQLLFFLTLLCSQLWMASFAR